MQITTPEPAGARNGAMRMVPPEAAGEPLNPRAPPCRDAIRRLPDATRRSNGGRGPGAAQGADFSFACSPFKALGAFFCHVATFCNIGALWRVDSYSIFFMFIQ
jgi:hypothetical protein